MICTPDRYCDHISARGRADHIYENSALKGGPN